MSVLLVTGAYDREIRFWDPTTGQCYRTIRYPDGQVNRLRFSPDRKYLAAAGHGHVRLFDVNSQNPSPVLSFDEHKLNVTGIGFQSEGKWLYTASEDGLVKIWDMRARGAQQEYSAHAAVNSVVLHPNQREIIIGDQSGRILVWDLMANDCSRELIPEEGDMPAIRSVIMTPDGSRMLAANNKGKVYVYDYDMAAYNPAKMLDAHDTYILNMACSPDGTMLATMSADHTSKIWRLADLHSRADPYKILTGHARWVWDGAFSRDSKFLLTVSSDLSARLWNIDQGVTKKTYTGHSKAVVCVALSDNAGSLPQVTASPQATPANSTAEPASSHSSPDDSTSQSQSNDTVSGS